MFNENKRDTLLEKLLEENKKQRKIYSKLHEIGKSINETINVDELFDIATNFVSKELNFEKCIIFKHDDYNGWFKVENQTAIQNQKKKKF